MLTSYKASINILLMKVRSMELSLHLAAREMKD
jgi:hypothetical protein